MELLLGKELKDMELLCFTSHGPLWFILNVRMNLAPGARLETAFTAFTATRAQQFPFLFLVVLFFVAVIKGCKDRKVSKPPLARRRGQREQPPSLVKDFPWNRMPVKETVREQACRKVFCPRLG